MSTGNPPIFGHPGPYFTTGSGITMSNGSSWQTLDLNLPDNKDFIDLKSRVEAIENRLAILGPNEELQARFPALQEAYDHYKLIEKLVNDGGKK